MNKKDILKHLGHQGQLVDRELDEKINHYMKIVDDFEGRFVYQIFEFDRQDVISVIGTILTLDGDSIRHIISQATRVIVFGATLGHEMDQMILKSSYDSALDMMILDACASVKIEDVLDQMESVITEDLGLYLTPRFSPGYGDLPLNIQHKLIKTIGADKVGITVTDSNILLPKKSVTGIIGVSEKKMDVSYKFCDECLLRTSCDFKKCRRD